MLSKATEEELVKRVGDLILTTEALEEAAKSTAEVIKAHRSVSRAGRALVSKLMDQLLTATADRPAIGDEIVLETMGDRDLNKRNRMLDAVSLPGHANTLKTLSVAAANFVKIEREAFGLDSGAPPADDPDKRPVSEITKDMAGEAYRKAVGG